jgi:hypothetical protein
MLEKIVKEMVWVRVRSMFMSFVHKHIENLQTDLERLNFIQLVNNDDEWSQQILGNLWAQFEEKELTNDKFESITKEVMQFLQKSAEI